MKKQNKPRNECGGTTPVYWSQAHYIQGMQEVTLIITKIIRYDCWYWLDRMTNGMYGKWSVTNVDIATFEIRCRGR